MGAGMRRVGAGAEDVKGMVWTAVDGAGTGGRGRDGWTGQGRVDRTGTGGQGPVDRDGWTGQGRVVRTGTGDQDRYRGRVNGTGPEMDSVRDKSVTLGGQQAPVEICRSPAALTAIWRHRACGALCPTGDP